MQHDNLSAFGLLVKRLRMAEGLTQEDLAERSMVSARLISDLERGSRHRPRNDTIQLLADGLRLSGANREAFVALARGGPTSGGESRPESGHGPRPGLPLPPTPILGRRKESAAASALLLRPEVRLLTLTGTGGIGKTRLALEVGARVAPLFPDGVCFVDLAPLHDPTLLRAAIAQALSRQREQEPLGADNVENWLQTKQILIVLDNFEHLLAAASDVANLLAWCPGLTILATSRAALRVRAEHTYDLAPLALPDPRDAAQVDVVGSVPAVEMFVDRANAANRSFALTPDNAPAVAAIVTRLDGLPLAIELAAARVRVLPPAALLDRLQQRLPLLSSAAVDVPERQRGLRAAIAWSYELLDPVERRLFRRLAVLEGSFSQKGVDAVASEATGSDPLAVLDLLTALVEKSLLRPAPSPGDDQRFTMLETIREFALERLAAVGEDYEVRSRHAAWCVELAATGGPEPTDPNQAQWFAELERDYPNLRAALGWTISCRDEESALRLGSALYRFWTVAGLLAEGSQWLQQILSTGVATPSVPRANALLGAGVIAFARGEYERAADHWTAAREMYHSLADSHGVAYALGNLGLIASHVTGDEATARTHFMDALAIFREVDNQLWIGYTLRNLGVCACFAGDYASAQAHIDEALALARSLDDQLSIAMSLGDLGMLKLVQGRFQQASALYTEALCLGRTLHNTPWTLRTLEHIVMLNTETGCPARAAKLFGAAGALRRTTGIARVPSEDALLHPYIARLRDHMGDEPFAAAWRSGERLSLEEATDYALGESGIGSPLGTSR